MSDVMYVATRKGLFTLEQIAGAWRIVDLGFRGDPVTMILPDPTGGTLYAALRHGHFGVKLHRLRGSEWEECAAPVYPEKPADLEELEPVRRIPIPWSLDQIWSLETDRSGQPGTLWCGTIPGGLFRSRDGGDSWELMRSLWDHEKRKGWMGGGYDLPGIHSICIDPGDPARVLAGVSVGGAWLSTDGGASWEIRSSGMRAEYMPPDQALDPYVQDPHRIVQCRARPEVLWTQHHNGIFRSEDGGESWHEIEKAGPSTFGFAAAVDPCDPDTAWFVPAEKDEIRLPVGGRLVVTRTRDGGKSFEELSRGLPADHACDLVYRHALDVDASGERLAFGSTTGSLWFSEDRGDRWRAVSFHLPPIYCVRFGEGG